MAFRINMIAACLAGSVVSVLLAVLLMLKFNSAFIAFLPTILIPPLSCWLGGLRRGDTLAMIAVFATIGWFAGTAFTPVVAMGPESQIELNAKMLLAGYDPIVPCAVCGGILAFGRACFVGSPKSTKIEESNTSLPDH